MQDRTPTFARCSMVTITLDPLETKSMAPPIPFTILPCQSINQSINQSIHQSDNLVLLKSFSLLKAVCQPADAFSSSLCLLLMVTFARNGRRNWSYFQLSFVSNQPLL